MNEEQVISRLAAVAEADRERSAPQAVEQAVLRAFREQQRHSIRVQHPAFLGWKKTAMAASASAAVLLLTFGLMNRRDVSAVPVIATQIAQPGTVNGVISSRSESDQEIATEFIALHPGTPIDPDGYSQLVRVSLPRTELARFGFPVSQDSAAASVNADVLLAEDGTATAVRFVQ